MINIYLISRWGSAAECKEEKPDLKQDWIVDDFWDAGCSDRRAGGARHRPAGRRGPDPCPEQSLWATSPRPRVHKTYKETYENALIRHPNEGMWGSGPQAVRSVGVAGNRGAEGQATEPPRRPGGTL